MSPIWGITMTISIRKLWDAIEDRVKHLEERFQSHEGKRYNPDKGYQQCRTPMGIYYHGQIKALASFAFNELYETKSRFRELSDD